MTDEHLPAPDVGAPLDHPEDVQLTEVVVAVDADHGAAMRDMVERLSVAGMVVEHTMDALGTVAGRVSPDRLDSIAAVPGVIAVERSSSVQLPPPSSDIQ